MYYIVTCQAHPALVKRVQCFQILVVCYWKNPGRQDLSFTPFVLSVLPVYSH